MRKLFLRGVCAVAIFKPPKGGFLRESASEAVANIMTEQFTYRLPEQGDREREERSDTLAVSILDASEVERAIKEEGVYTLPPCTKGHVRVEAVVNNGSEAEFLGVKDLGGLEVVFESPRQEVIPEGISLIGLMPGTRQRKDSIRAWINASQGNDGDEIIASFEGIRIRDIRAAQAFMAARTYNIDPSRVGKVVITVGVSRQLGVGDLPVLPVGK